MKKIGFIGVGIMGKSMVRNLMKAGFEVAIYTRTKAKVEDVIAEGAIWRDTVKECVADRDAVISIVGYPKDVEGVYFGENGILKNLPKGGYAIDMTTSSPKTGREDLRDGQGSRPSCPGCSGNRWRWWRESRNPDPFWQAETARTLMPACRYLRPWERTSIMRARPEMASTPRCATRSPLRARFPERARPWLTQMQLDWIRRPCWTPSLPERQAVPR